jgi:membrane-associated protease RseP (regulator of RpoE activity)
MLATLVTLTCAASVAFGASGEVFGFSSDEFGGESSYLGVDTRDISADRLAALHLKEERGVEVTLVDQDAPAGKAGIKEHDVILSINGDKVESVEQLRRMIHEIPPGRLITVGLSRDGNPLTVKAQLNKRTRAFAMAPKGREFNFQMPAIPAIPAIPAMPEMDFPVSVVIVNSSMRSGLMVENLTPQLGDFLGAKNGQGVLVRSVEKGSRAEKAGFRAGDVIVKVNGETVADSSDFGHALRGRNATTVPVNIIRDKKEQTLTLTLPERKQSQNIEEMSDQEDEDAMTIDLSEVKSEIAHLKPQMELAAREMRNEMQKAKPQMERAQREWSEQSREIRRETEKMKRDAVQQGERLRQRMRQELAVPLADI